ncbi:MAG: transposase [Thermoplasmata archaeon]|nr:transposase [Thermoplasmata archaeon]
MQKKRNRKEYNEKLVKRGEYYVNPRFPDAWLDEIKKMNHRKVGQPFLYPTSMIEFLAFFKSKGFDYRSLQGIMRGFSKKLPLSFRAKSTNLVVACDGSEMRVSNRGEWIREKWRIRRGWIKVVIMGDTKGNIVDIRIGNENLNERASSRGMIRKNISMVIMDGYHDCEDTFNLCNQLRIEPSIKIRENASNKGLSPRSKEVRLFQKLGYEKWKREKGYGMRWPASESIFSAVKRMFNENVQSHKTRNMYHESKVEILGLSAIKRYSVRFRLDDISVSYVAFFGIMPQSRI